MSVKPTNGLSFEDYIRDSEAEVSSQLFSGITIGEDLLLGGYTKSASTRKQRIR
jgi:hypothetical protein